MVIRQILCWLKGEHKWEMFSIENHIVRGTNVRCSRCGILFPGSRFHWERKPVIVDDKVSKENGK